MARIRALSGLLVVLAAVAHAEDRHLMQLQRQLSLATNPAARSKAAQALGKLDDEDAVGPLCSALGTDADPTVRAEAARALGALGGGAAKACLDKHRADAIPQARAAVGEALERLRTAEADREVRRAVIVRPLDAKHNALGEDAGALALRQLRRALPRHGAWVPEPGANDAQIRRALKDRKLPGFSLALKLTAADGGGVNLDLLCTRYPSGGLIGDVTVSAKGGDTADLIRALIPRALDEADVSCGWRVE